MKIQTRRGERGSALLITMVILVLLGIIGLAGLNTVTRDRQSAGYSNRAQRALYAAEAGVAQGQRLVAGVTTPGAPPPTLPVCTATAQYCGDPRATNPIEHVGTFQDLASGDDISQGEGRFFNSLWRIRVQGQVAGGGAARVESVVSNSSFGGFSYNN